MFFVKCWGLFFSFLEKKNLCFNSDRYDDEDDDDDDDDDYFMSLGVTNWEWCV